jgi:hypothetical protein
VVFSPKQDCTGECRWIAAKKNAAAVRNRNAASVTSAAVKRQEQEKQRKLQRNLAKQQREKRRREAAAAKQPGEKGALTRFVFGGFKTIAGRFQSAQAAQRKDEGRKKVQSIFRVIGGSSGSRKLTPEEEATFARMKANAEERKTERQAAAQRRIEGYGIELGKGPRPGVAGDDEGARS